MDNATWFNIFNIIFELVSAYGTVGLSLGVPYDNFSLSGSFSTLSKLVVIVVMLRGRHRGLPVAIDRAVMLPKDFTAAEEQAFEEERSRRVSRRGSDVDFLPVDMGRVRSRRMSVSRDRQAENGRGRGSENGSAASPPATGLTFALPRHSTEASNASHASYPSLGSHRGSVFDADLGSRRGSGDPGMLRAHSGYMSPVPEGEGGLSRMPTARTATEDE